MTHLEIAMMKVQFRRIFHSGFHETIQVRLMLSNPSPSHSLLLCLAFPRHATVVGRKRMYEGLHKKKTR